MKIVLFSSGLGNQIFQYFFSLYLQDVYSSQVYGYYNRKFLNKHNGLEVGRVFDIVLPPHTWISDMSALSIRILNGMGVKSWIGNDECKQATRYFDGYWQDKKYFSKYVKNLKFRKVPLSVENTRMISLIQDTLSVALHVRRGDYCDSCRKDLFMQACTPAYYEEAICRMIEKFHSPTFFVFSDDISWVKENMSIPNVYYIDWNKSEDSYLDMYLMSQCKANIIANSTFSFWGAMLGNEKDIVIRPKRWIGNDVPDIFPSSWYPI